MHDAPRVWIQRTDLLQPARRADLLHHEHRHLAEFSVLAFAETERIDDVVALATSIATKRGVHDDLQRVERFAFYDLGRRSEVGLVIATGEARIYANIMLTIGVVKP